MQQEIQGSFDELLHCIQKSRSNALRSVNCELIQLYWTIGKYLAELVSHSPLSDEVIKEAAEYIVRNNHAIKGFTQRNLVRMKNFYHLYKDDTFVQSVMTQVSWTNHLQIIAKSRSREERHFYISLCIKEKYTARELERQIETSYYERYMLSENKKLPKNISKDIRRSMLDPYVLEFLNVPVEYNERNLRRAIIENLKKFLLEFGRDFSFIGEEYRIQVGGEDFSIDLLFYNRSLACLVPVELKLGKFRPEHVGQINFYLEALDRDVRKPNENPSVGVLLCAGKDDAVVEYALSRSLSPMLVAEYSLVLPDKKLLQEKLRELTGLALEQGEEDAPAPGYR